MAWHLLRSGYNEGKPVLTVISKLSEISVWTYASSTKEKGTNFY